jgi:predicted component of type VI protein secretion system
MDNALREMISTQQPVERMEKLVVLNETGVVQEFPLGQKQVSLGRDQTNDLCLSDKSVSRRHATVVRIHNEYFLEDAKSTNGTRLNGVDVKKHILKHGDLIEVGIYRLRFERNEPTQEAEEDLEKTVVIPSQRKKTAPPPAVAESRPKRADAVAEAQVRFLSGPDTGDVKTLDRAFTTIGRPGGDLILINRRHTGYFLLKMGGNNTPSVNGEPVRIGGMELHNGDKLKLGELELEFIQ